MAFDTAWPMALSSVLRICVTSAEQPPQPVPTLVHFLRAGISVAPPRMAEHTTALVTLLHEHTMALSEICICGRALASWGATSRLSGNVGMGDFSRAMLANRS